MSRERHQVGARDVITFCKFCEHYRGTEICQVHLKRDHQETVVFCVYCPDARVAGRDGVMREKDGVIIFESK